MPSTSILTPPIPFLPFVISRGLLKPSCSRMGASDAQVVKPRKGKHQPHPAVSEVQPSQISGFTTDLSMSTTTSEGSLESDSIRSGGSVVAVGRDLAEVLTVEKIPTDYDLSKAPATLSAAFTTSLSLPRAALLPSGSGEGVVPASLACLLGVLVKRYVREPEVAVAVVRDAACPATGALLVDSLAVPLHG